jgi:formylglycine-generating enzyme required for sulfatase activity
MKRIAPIALALLLLAGCERTPEPPPPAPKTEVVAPAVVTPPAEVPVPLPIPEIVSAPAPRVVKAGEARLPTGFVRLGSGSVTDAGGQLRQTPSFAIAREPVSNAQLREWAESEGGRRLPQLLGASDAEVATDLDWLAADAYARWLSTRDKRHYRLPTELEWRRAAQSGRVLTQAQRQPAEPPLWEWTGDCWGEDGDAGGSCASRVLVGGEHAGTDGWGRAPMGARRPAASFRLVLDLK